MGSNHPRRKIICQDDNYCVSVKDIISIIVYTLSCSDTPEGQPVTYYVQPKQSGLIEISSKVWLNLRSEAA